MPRQPLTHESSEWSKSNICRLRSLHCDRSLNHSSHRSEMTTGSTATLARLLSNGLGARGDQDRDPLEYPRRNLHVLLALSGSVASIKAPLIVRELLTVRPHATALPLSAAVTPLRLCPFRLAPNGSAFGYSTPTSTSRSSLRNHPHTSFPRKRSSKNRRVESESGPTQTSGPYVGPVCQHV